MSSPFRRTCRDMDWLPGLVVQRRVEVEFVEPDERRHGRFGMGNLDAFHLGRGPDAEAFALAPDAPLATQGVSQREMEAVEFDVGVEAFRQSLDHLLADERLRAMGEDVDEDGHGRQKRKYDSRRPKRPAGYASARNPASPVLHPLVGCLPIESAHHFLIGRPMQLNCLAAMQDQIENLVKLQTVEMERGRLAQMHKALPAQISRGRVGSGLRCRAKSAAASDALNREDSLRTKLEREIAAHRQKAAPLQGSAGHVTTPAQAAAIEHEVQFARPRLNGWKMRNLPAWSAPKLRRRRWHSPGASGRACSGRWTRRGNTWPASRTRLPATGRARW